MQTRGSKSHGHNIRQGAIQTQTRKMSQEKCFTVMRDTILKADLTVIPTCAPNNIGSKMQRKIYRKH